MSPATARRAAYTAATIVLLTGCAATPQPTTTPAATPTPTTPVAAVTLCDTYDPGDRTHAPGGDEIQTVLEQTPLPEPITLNPGLQTVHTTGEPDGIEAVIGICAPTPLAHTELVDVATTLAIAIRHTPAAEDTLQRLVVTAWTPAGEYLDTTGHVATDYQTFTWDPDAATPPTENWD